jgi:NAD(P)-dependent dehydrogenase (short-subunit alcohol dehydrogenase family)
MTATTVLITGTTSGVGRALLEHYARGGASVIAVNRRRIPELEAAHPTVRFECADVQSAEEVRNLVRSLAESGRLPEIFILNAGINRVDNDESFELGAYRSVLETNLYGVLNFVEPLLTLPGGSSARHVVAVSSMARYVGNPYGLGYTTSKQALTECFDVWARMYTGTDLVFQQVMLGPVRTAIHSMADQFPGWMVWLRDAFSAPLDGTARAIARFALTRRRKLHYPWRAVPLYAGMWLVRALVPGFFRGRKTLRGDARRGLRSARASTHEGTSSDGMHR